MVDSISMGRLNTLHPRIRQKAIDAYTEACRITPVGVHPFITETTRSFERSAQLYNQGRTTPGPIVSNAKAGQSLHNYSLAIDFMLQINGKSSWVVDANWIKVANVFKKYGFSWGGDWTSFKDYPHVENRLGYTVTQLLAKHNAGLFIPGTSYLQL